MFKYNSNLFLCFSDILNSSSGARVKLTNMYFLQWFLFSSHSFLLQNRKKNEYLIICFSHLIVLSLNGPSHHPKTPFEEVMYMKIANTFSE